MCKVKILPTFPKAFKSRFLVCHPRATTAIKPIKINYLEYFKCLKLTINSRKNPKYQKYKHCFQISMQGASDKMFIKKSTNFTI